MDAFVKDINMLCFLLLLLSQSETVKLLPQDLVTYKLFGEPEGPHYAHYDLVGGRLVCIPILPENKTWGNILTLHLLTFFLFST